MSTYQFGLRYRIQSGDDTFDYEPGAELDVVSRDRYGTVILEDEEAHRSIHLSPSEALRYGRLVDGDTSTPDEPENE